MTNKPEDMPADLYWLAVNVSEMPGDTINGVGLDSDGEVRFYSGCGNIIEFDYYPESNTVKGLNTRDGDFYPVSEWQAAREQLGLCAPTESEPDGEWSDWIEWSGGECPLPDGATTEVRLRGLQGERRFGFSEKWSWKHSGFGCDIIAYRYRLDSAPKSINDANPEEWDAVNTEKPVWVGVDMANEKDETVTCARVNKPTRSKYHREIYPGVWVDVYDVLVAFNVTNPADAHAIKKMLMPGERGEKDGIQDRREAIASLKRAIEIEEKANK